MAGIGVVGLIPARPRRRIAQAVSLMGTASAISGTRMESPTATLAMPTMVMAARTTPRKWLPVSPMKVRAGGRLKTRNPAHTPISAPPSITTPDWTSPGATIRLIAASTATMATIPTTPAATPSAPSRKLIETLHP